MATMFKSFLKSRPIVSIFHHPSSPQSIRALALLKSSLTNPYPPGTPNARPLDFDLEVVESAPTPDQVSTILSYLPSSRQSVQSTFLSPHFANSDKTPNAEVDAESLGKIVQMNAKTLKWPIVVDWTGGRASIGNVDDVKVILDAIKESQC